VESQKRRRSREIMPADGRKPAERNERGFRHVPAYRRAALRRVNTAYLAPTGVAKSKDCCRLSNAATSLPRLTMFLACAATSRRDVPRSWRLPRLQRDSRERSRSPLADLGHILTTRDSSSLRRFGLGTHVRNGSKSRSRCRSAPRPFCPRDRTSSGRPAMSASCPIADLSGTSVAQAHDVV
jgi:hypothetical protein